MITALRVLIVEDSESDAELIIRQLKKEGYEISFERVETAAAMKASLVKQPWDVVIADYKLPRFSAPAALTLLHESGLDIPFIVVSGTIGEETAVELMRSGAHDYVMKNNLSRLVSAVQRELQEAELRREHKRTEHKLYESEKRYRMLFDAIDEGFCIIEVIFDENEKPIDYRFLEVNPAFEKQTGSSMHRQGIRELLPRSMRIVGSIFTAQIALTGQPARFANRATSRLHRWYDVYAFRCGRPENRQVAILFNDITERKQSEENLLLEKQKTRDDHRPFPLRARIHRS